MLPSRRICLLSLAIIFSLQTARSAEPEPRHLKIAESKYGLGTCTPGHIDWVKIER